MSKALMTLTYNLEPQFTTDEMDWIMVHREADPFDHDGCMYVFLLDDTEWILEELESDKDKGHDIVKRSLFNKLDKLFAKYKIDRLDIVIAS